MEITAYFKKQKMHFEATVNEAAKEDIKKKTSLLLYGNFDDTENFTAEKVIITQYE